MSTPVAHHFVGAVALVMSFACLSVSPAFSAPDAPSSATSSSRAFPLDPCTAPGEKDCVVRTAALVEAKQKRMPIRFLELWDPAVRKAICDASTYDGHDTCETALAALSDYLIPGGKLPDKHSIGVALEGGGSKASPFSLGVLAGLQEADILPARVGAVSSVSGGSYAASFQFNRLWDRYAGKVKDAQNTGRCRAPAVPVAADLTRSRSGESGYADWFRSCIPDAYADASGVLGHLQSLPACGERPSATGPGVTHDFLPEYAFQGHVWRWPDLLFSDQRNQLKTDRRLRGPELAQTGLLTLASMATAPLQLISRSLFHWPINTAPSKAAYRHGIDREFGFSPADWKAAIDSPEGVAVVAAQRSRERTLGCLGAILPAQGEPTWIVNSSTPGPVTVVDWITTSSRDPLMNSFELTPTGYGSGLYGYATMPPRFRFEFDGFAYTPRDMSMTDAVVASAAFFDDNQSLISSQPQRLAAGLFQHALNLTWFTDIPNYNVDRWYRVRNNAKPYPLWGIPTNGKPETTAYIHLQDGGNSENTGIFALLRRGYRTIIYAHGTEDRDAKFPALCHLKNILELHGAYRIDSDELDQQVAKLGHRKAAGKAPQFETYLDQLCSHQLDESIRASFGSEMEGRVSPLSRVYCSRLPRPEDHSVPCLAYQARFPVDRSRHVAPIPETWSVPKDIFFRWTGTSLTFTVRRVMVDDRGQPKTPGEDDLIATIIAVVPAIAWNDFKTQLGGPASDVQAADSWAPFCNRDTSLAAVRIEKCAVPPKDDDARKSADGFDLPVPCNAAAFLLSNACKQVQAEHYVKTTGAMAHKDRPLLMAEFKRVNPGFPQDSFISTTLNSSYLMFAAYYDLGRHFARTVGKCLGEDPPLSEWKCNSRLVAARSD